ncbi:uncharacterized protein [Miscanthus floridulus]|uniref:uncharacterized protein n=1 Tax=Miscanthus floridulus TaxID=154761 RepID=UPI0034574C41
MHTVHEVSGTSWLTLTHTNYGKWAVTTKVKLRARRLWNAIDKGTDNEEDDMSALEAILAAMPAQYREPLGAKNNAKEEWEAIAAMRVGSDRVKKATAQLLKQEYATLKFKDGESVEDFSLRLQSLISKLRSHGVTINEEQAVSKYLYSVPATAMTDSGKLLLIEEEWAVPMKMSGKPLPVVVAMASVAARLL